MIKRILQIKYGDTTIPESWIYAGGDPNIQKPIILSIFYIETDNRKILVDTGCETMPGFIVQNFERPITVLKQRGITPDDITDIILTHAHHDHIACTGYFPMATVHIQQEEYEAAKPYLLRNSFVDAFQDEMTPDANIRVIKIGGHSIGSCVVECEVEGKTVVLCGDECYSDYNLIHSIPTAATYSAEKSAAFVKKYSQNMYVCMLCHKEF